MNRNIIVCISLILFSSILLKAQQQVMFTQYMFNGLAINPAYAGSHESLSLTALAREQWTGINGAPSTQTFTAHTALKNKKIGLGAMLLHDEIGITEQTGAYLSYAYRIQTSGAGVLSLGLQGGFTHFNAQLSKIESIDTDVKETQPNVGLGAFYSNERFYLGFSVPQMLETTFDRDKKDSDSKLVRHYFANIGYVFDLGSSLKFKPNALVKAVSGAPVEFDLNANFLINEVFWIGASWRSFDSIDALFRIQLFDRFQVGYAYDFATTTDLKRVNGGSHEFMLNYRVPTSKNKFVTPRYF